MEIEMLKKKIPKYKVGDRLCYLHDGDDYKTHHFVGYVKQVRPWLFGVTYVMIVTNSDIIHFVRERDIFGELLPKTTSNTQSK